MMSRFERSLEASRPNTLFEDGRRPVYFALLDLPSKPFWKPDECDGAVALLQDLQDHAEELRNEVRSLRGKDKGNGWSVFTVCGDGQEPAENELPLLISLLRRHPCVSSFTCPFQVEKLIWIKGVLLSCVFPQASLLSVLGPGGLPRSNVFVGLNRLSQEKSHLTRVRPTFACDCSSLLFCPRAAGCGVARSRASTKEAAALSTIRLCTAPAIRR